MALDAWIIDKLRKQEEERKKEQERPRLELPLYLPEEEGVLEKEEENKEPIVIQLYG